MLVLNLERSKSLVLNSERISVTNVSNPSHPDIKHNRLKHPYKIAKSRSIDIYEFSAHRKI